MRSVMLGCFQRIDKSREAASIVPLCEANENFLAHIRISVLQLAVQRVSDFERILIAEKPKPERDPVAHLGIGIFHEREQCLDTEWIFGKRPECAGNAESDLCRWVRMKPGDQRNGLGIVKVV